MSYGEDGYLYLERNAYVRGETLIGLEHYDKHMKRAAHTGNERINNQSLEDVLFHRLLNLQMEILLFPGLTIQQMETLLACF